MNLDRLELFLKIVETGSVSAAGRKAHLTQPAVSRNLKLLEEEIGATLFERQARGLSLTPAGRALVPRALRLVQEAGRARAEVRRASERAAFDLRIGAVDSIGTHIIAPCLTELRAQFPELAIKFHMGRTQELLKRVENASLDLAVVAYSAPPTEQSVRLGTYSLKYYGLKARFAQISEMKTETEIRAMPLIELQALPGQPSMISDDTDDFAVTMNISAVKALVLSGFGVGALLPFMLSAQEQQLLACAEKLQHDPDCGMYGVPSWREFSNEENAAHSALLEAITRRLSAANKEQQSVDCCDTSSTESTDSE